MNARCRECACDVALPDPICRDCCPDRRLYDIAGQFVVIYRRLGAMKPGQLRELAFNACIERLVALDDKLDNIEAALVRRRAGGR